MSSSETKCNKFSAMNVHYWESFFRGERLTLALAKLLESVTLALDIVGQQPSPMKVITFDEIWKLVKVTEPQTSLFASYNNLLLLFSKDGCPEPILILKSSSPGNRSSMYEQTRLKQKKTLANSLETVANIATQEIKQKSILNKNESTTLSTMPKKGNTPTTTLIEEMALLRFIYDFGHRNMVKENLSGVKNGPGRNVDVFLRDDVYNVQRDQSDVCTEYDIFWSEV